jgi:NTE family protein
MLLALLCGCASYFPVNDRMDEWSKRGYRASRRWSSDRSQELLLVLAFSGGGTRAASFAYGVLEELEATRVTIDDRETTLLDEVDHISGVSGGSFPAAYFGLHGRGIFGDFEERFLKRNVQRSLLAQLLWPWNWVLLFSPYFERSDLVARYYDRILFEKATFADLEARNGPLVQINATDLATGGPFSFIQEQFDFLCSDLSSYSISRAVSASSAVPGPLSPLTLENYGGTCGFLPPDWIPEAIASGRSFGRAYVNARNLASYGDSKRRRFVRLVDGGVSDNLAVRGPFEADVLSAPQEGERAGRFPGVRWLVFILVNAATTPDTAWEELDEAPTLMRIIDQTATVQINRYSIETIELLRSTFARWREVSEDWSEPAGFHLIELDFTRHPDVAERRYLNRLPTSFHLEAEAVDRLQRAGRTILRDSPAYAAFLEDLER